MCGKLRKCADCKLVKKSLVTVEDCVTDGKIEMLGGKI